MGERSNTQASIGAFLDLPHDRSTLERFRQAFPRARWSDSRNTWFVPGKTAETRIARWRAALDAEGDRFADEKGQDAFAFDPIESRYLQAEPDALLIRTPYSKSLVFEIRGIPGARWDAARRVWAVPYRSCGDLRSRWPVIEEIATRSEPEARKMRRDAMQGTVEADTTKRHDRERRRKRYPIEVAQPPPLDRIVSTHIGAIVPDALDGELADHPIIEGFYFRPEPETTYVWISWRHPILEELIGTWPARSAPTVEDRARGWWWPTLDELRVARREARSREKARRHRLQKGPTDEPGKCI